MKTILIRVACILFFLCLLLFPQTAVAGATDGLLLWYRTVLPTLLPAMILSDLLLRIHGDVYLTALLHRPLEALFHCSREGSYAVLIGMLAGYPMGAKTVQTLRQSGRIDSAEAVHLMHFVNQPSPMFLIGYVSLRMLSQGDASLHRRMLPLLLLSVWGSAWLCCLLSRLDARGRGKQIRPHRMDGGGRRKPDPAPRSQAGFRADSTPDPQKTTNLSLLSSLEQSMMTSFEVMVKIGGYMILFSILEAFWSGIPSASPLFRILVSGTLEMTTGIKTAADLCARIPAAAFCCMIVSFGGLSSYAQTRNVISPVLNRQSHYLAWKLLQAALAFLLSLLLSAGSRLVLRHLLPG